MNTLTDSEIAALKELLTQRGTSPAARPALRRIGAGDLDAASGSHGPHVVNVTDLTGTPHRILVIDAAGVVTELAIGANNTVLKGEGVSTTPTFGAVLVSELGAGGNWKLLHSDGSGVWTELAFGAAGTYLKSNGPSAAPTWETITVALKTQAPGYFQIPTGPAVGTTATSGAANTFGAWAQMIASTAAALYIVGVAARIVSNAVTYVTIDIGVGAAASEVSQGMVHVKLQTDTSGDNDNWGHVILPFPIPVASGVRIACRSGDSVGGLGCVIALTCIAQANLVAL